MAQDLTRPPAADDANPVRILFLVTIASALVACGTREPTPPSQPADTLYTNAVVWTGVVGAPDARILAVTDGTISYVGDDRDVPVDAAEVIDLGGRFLMPGFVDNHVHFLYGGAGLAGVDLRDAATPEEFTRRIGGFAATLRPGRWVLNGEWDHTLWGGELPRKEWIDAATRDTPVFVSRLDGHMALANSAALALAGISADTETPAGGEIVRDADGDPTGILKDNAMNLVFAMIPEPTPEERLRMFELAQAQALSLGLVEVHDMSNGPAEAESLETFRLARDRGLMQIRVRTFPHLEHWRRAAARIADEGAGDARLSSAGVKGFVDGSLGSSTAWFHEPYLHDPSNSGFPLVEPAVLREQMAAADAAGLRLAVHGIGDRAIDFLIDAMRGIAGEDITARRYRIEHFQHPTADAIRAAAANGIIASMQPYHAIDDGRWAESRIGPERARTTYAFRAIIDAGGILTFGSDWPVAPLAPLEGVYAAVTRSTIDGANPDGWQPQEKISVEEALRAYTAANAYAVFDEGQAGTLETGKRADLVVLSEDPRTVAPSRIRNIEVLQTVIAGRRVYGK